MRVLPLLRLLLLFAFNNPTPIPMPMSLPMQVPLRRIVLEAATVDAGMCL